MLGEKKAKSERSHVALSESDIVTLPGKPQPCDNARINVDGLIQDMSQQKIWLSYWSSSIANNIVSV